MKKSQILQFAILLSFFLNPVFSQKRADITFMHDVHSFLEPASKAKTVINNQLKKNPDTIIVDAGDFSMGTLYQTIFETNAAELRTLGRLGVEGTTIGNHEFDYGIDGLVKMFKSALDSGEKLPEFLLCNVDWAVDNEYTQKFKAIMDEYGRKDYVMIKKGDLNVALIGCFGEDAFLCSPTCELRFRDINAAVKETVAKIKAEEKADMIICLSHSGTNSNPKLSEDENLAKAVPELDVIISGHTHTKLEKPILVGDTHIVSCESYLHYLGNLSLEQKENGRWKQTGYTLIDLSSDIPADEEMTEILTLFKEKINKEYLSIFGMESEQIVTNSPYNYDEISEVGYLMADSIAKTLKDIGQDSDIVVVPSGVIRGIYNKGPVTVSKVFETFSLGIGKDRLTGYPLMKVWIKGSELENVCELDASLSSLMTYVRLYPKGLAYKYNTVNFIMDKVVEVYSVDEAGSFTPIEKDKLYSVVVDMYTGLMLGNILKTTKGLVSIVPRDVNGNPVENYDDAIVYRPDGSELKGWYAIAKNLDNCIGDYSNRRAEYKKEIHSYAFADRFSNPSKIGVIFSAVLLVLILLVIFVVVGICKKIKKGKKTSK